MTTRHNGYAGGLYDRDLKLVSFGARDYDPQIGRWLSKDPLRFDAGDTNLYAYSFGDPVNLVDPTGQSPCPKPKRKHVKKGEPPYINARDVIMVDPKSDPRPFHRTGLQWLQPGAEVEFLGYDPTDRNFVIVRSNGQIVETLGQSLSIHAPQLDVISSDGKPIDDQAYASSGATKA